eukprot:scaffold174055_cov13-Tisochrysis_lutea.AAC.1
MSDSEAEVVLDESLPSADFDSPPEELRRMGLHWQQVCATTDANRFSDSPPSRSFPLFLPPLLLVPP